MESLAWLERSYEAIQNNISNPCLDRHPIKHMGDRVIWRYMGINLLLVLPDDPVLVVLGKHSFYGQQERETEHGI